jgi:hypothetical protein
MPPLLAFSAVSQYTAALMLLLMVIFSPTHGAQITQLVPSQLQGPRNISLGQMGHDEHKNKIRQSHEG